MKIYLDLQSTKETILFWQEILFGKVKDFLQTKKIEVEVIIFLTIVLHFLSRLPYLNIFIEGQITYFILIILVIFLFKIKKERILIFIFILFFLALLEMLFGEEKTAENLGNQIYFLLWIVVLKYFKQLWKEI